MSHMSTPCSKVPLARRCPLELQATLKKTVSSASRSRRAWTQLPVVGSHSRMLRSRPQLVSREPSGLHATPRTLARCPPNTLGAVLLSASHSDTRPSEPALARWEPPPCLLFAGKGSKLFAGKGSKLFAGKGSKGGR